MRLPDMKHTVLMSPADSKLVDGIKKLGINVINAERITALRDNEQFHSDMQLLVIRETAFIPKNCTQLVERISDYFEDIIICSELSREYPNNVGLNAALVADKLFCKETALDPTVKNFCLKNGIEIINVNQGYAKCSTLIINDNSIITADKTIYEAALQHDIKALCIRQGHIKLQDADYGFIGGCSGRIGDTVIFFGDIYRHPDARLITDFLEQEKVSHVCVTDEQLNDIGGFVMLK